MVALCRKPAVGRLEEGAETGEVAGRRKAEVVEEEEVKRSVAMAATAVPLLLVVMGFVMALLALVPVVVAYLCGDWMSKTVR